MTHPNIKVKGDIKKSKWVIDSDKIIKALNENLFANYDKGYDICSLNVGELINNTRIVTFKRVHYSVSSSSSCPTFKTLFEIEK